MDRLIDKQTQQRRLRRRALTALALAAGVTLLVTLLTGWIRPSVRRADLRLARVERGPVEATIMASGIVLPAYERVIVSPVDTRVARILRKPGDAVTAGDEIVGLDRAEPEAELRSLDDQLELKRNAREQARLKLENALTDLRGRAAVKSLEQKSLRLEAARNAQLLEMGAISQDAARAVQNRLDTAGIELAQLGESMDQARRDLDIQLHGIDLEMSILRRTRAESAARLARATATADRAGVVTWVVPVEGVSVARGAEIARIADLGAYRVEATLSDVHAGRIARGQSARIRVGEHFIAGRLVNIRPTVENGIMSAEVTLEESAYRDLRPQLRVDVHIVTDRREETLRLANGSALAVDGRTAFFVISGKRALRRPVELGLRGIDASEVISGLIEGDEVIVSDMSNFKDAREVRVR